MTETRRSDPLDPDPRQGVDAPVVAALAAYYGSLDLADDGLLITDAEGVVSYLNRSLARQAGLDRTVVVGRAVGSLLAAREAAFDSVTGLAGESLLSERARPVLALARRKDRSVAVGLLAVDGRTASGAAADGPLGDQVLRAVASRLTATLRETDLIGRLPDGSFVLVLQEVATDESLGRAARRIIEKISEPLRAGAEDVTLSGRLGMALFPRDASGWDELLARAAGALERAREAEVEFMFHEEEFTSRTHDRLRLEREFADASEASELLLHYQPVVAARSGEMVGAEALARGQVMGIEALARWPHQDLGLVPPADFIPIAEATGRILSLDRWAIATAIRQGSTWWERGWDGWVSVNLSTRSLRDPELVDFIADVLRGRGVDGERLMLEITESAAMRDPDATIAILHSLEELGVRIAIDDFGTGHSSLAYLRRLPVDLLKLDRSFIADLGTRERDRWIVESIVGLAHRMGAQVVAEGVEEPKALEWLRAAGCDLVQGYLIGRPAPADELDPSRA
jgi:diguanylate cyclase (GGDEF)-like protein